MKATQNSRKIYRARIDSAIAFINAHLSDDLSLDPIARAAGFSPFHFHRIFTAIVGETPHDFVNRIRLESAANLLIKAPSRSITSVAFACGFSSSAAFARAFKKHFGTSASAYRKHPLAPKTESPLPQGIAPHDHALVEAVCANTVIKEMPRFHVAYIASLKGYSLPQICKTWKSLYKWAAARDLLTPQATMIGVSFDDPLITPKHKCRYDACITVPASLPFAPNVGIMDIPEGKCAVCHLTCTAEEIPRAYRAFYGAWLPNSGCQPADRPCYEIYYAEPKTEAGNFVLDICFPIMPL